VAHTGYRLDILPFGSAVLLVWDGPNVHALGNRFGGTGRHGGEAAKLGRAHPGTAAARLDRALGVKLVRYPR